MNSHSVTAFRNQSELIRAWIAGQLPVNPYDGIQGPRKNRLSAIVAGSPSYYQYYFWNTGHTLLFASQDDTTLNVAIARDTYHDGKPNGDFLIGPSFYGECRELLPDLTTDDEPTYYAVDRTTGERYGSFSHSTVYPESVVATALYRHAAKRWRYDGATPKVSNRLYRILERASVDVAYIPDEMILCDVEDDGTITVLPANRLNTEKKLCEQSGRQSLRPGRFLRRVMDGATDHEIECATNTVKALAGPASFEIVHGEDIRFWYHNMNYALSSGTLNSSCMAGDCAQQYLDIYTENPDRVRLITLQDGGELIGRALLWKIDGHADTYVMDRIYGTDATIEKFKQYARENGWWHRTKQNYDPDPSFMLPDGSIQHGGLTVTLKKSNFDQYPFMDTFAYLSGDILATDDGEWHLHSTDGGYEDNAPRCYNCGDTADTSDDRGYDYCQYCYDERYAQCAHCYGELRRDDAMPGVDGASYCEDCWGSLFCTCEWCGAEMPQGDATIVGYRTLCASCADDVETCDECGESFESGDLIRHHCRSCYEHIAETSIELSDVDPCGTGGMPIQTCPSCDTQHVGRYRICRSCANFRCDRCNGSNMDYRSHIVRVRDNGERICQACAERPACVDCHLHVALAECSDGAFRCGACEMTRLMAA